MKLLIIQFQCYYISSLKQYKKSGSLLQSSSILIFSLRTRSHFRKDNHRLSSESQKAVISTPDIDYSFSINPPWTWKYNPYHWVYRFEVMVIRTFNLMEFTNIRPI